MDSIATISEMKDRMQKFVLERKWKSYHTPKELAIALNIESSELLENFLFRSYGVEEIMKSPDLMKKIEDEVADVFAYLLSFCTSLKIDLSDAYLRKMEKNDRKYPSEEFQGNYEKR